EAKIADARRVLRSAVLECSERGLYHASKWAAEQIVGLARPTLNPSDTPTEPVFKIPQRSSRATASSALSPPLTKELDDAEEDSILLARSYFQTREFQRAAYAVRHGRSLKAVWWRLYSKYMAGEKSKDENVASHEEEAPAVNNELHAIAEELKKMPEKDNDPFLQYLYGIVTSAQDQKHVAEEALISSVTAFPANWSAWVHLAGLITNQFDLYRIYPKLPDHFMRQFFLVSVTNNRCYQVEQLPDDIRGLKGLFPGSTYLKAQFALARYNQREFEEAEPCFSELMKNDPYAVDHLDKYSNLLYVEKKSAKLFNLAQHAYKIDRYRHETCCILGNYFSLKGEHQMAVTYFQRAIKLNRNCYEAYTLLGHEYIEMSNTDLAIEAYRRATQLNAGEFRAWYGLGQCYLILKGHQMALFYFEKAVALKPYDTRIWITLGQVYKLDGRIEEAIACFKRDLVINGAHALISLASIYAE
ncbi:hypothetical protein BDK51DRAFT_7956, partial [Blyttiomyces helicus]